MPHTSPTNERQAVRHNQALTTTQLWEQTAKAVEESGKSQSAIARELGVSPGAVNHALIKPEDESQRYVELQMRILDLLTPYRVEREVAVRFRILRKSETT